MSSVLPTLSKTLECVVKQVCLTTHSFELLSTILESVKAGCLCAQHTLGTNLPCKNIASIPLFDH